jgi:hypothetical protein
VKVLVCGSRDWPDSALIGRVVAGFDDDTIVIEGGAIGADAHAKKWATDRGLFVADVPVRSSHWKRHGKSAGHKRNHAMLDLGPDLVVAFQHNESAGTQGTIDEARRRGIPVEIHTSEPPS